MHIYITLSSHFSLHRMAALPAVQIVLTEDIIPGASLDYDKIETYTVAELKWWLKCRDVHPPTSWRKAQLIDKSV